MNEWTEMWELVKGKHRKREHQEIYIYAGPVVDETGTVTHATKTQFTIHCARYLLAQHQNEGWEILHVGGQYPPEEWVGNPSHHIVRNTQRLPKHPGLTFVHGVTIPPDHKER